MHHYEVDENNLQVKMYFNYPNEDLYERKHKIQKLPEFIKFLKEMLAALATLEEKKMVHGNVRP